jgi:hypothetical protein
MTAQQTVPSSEPDKIKLRFDFIGMVFALAISQVGLEIGDFFKYNISIIHHFYVLSHLILSVYVIASSWIGWQTSKSDGNHQPINNVFDRSFLVLLVDLILVFFYFILVKGVEKPTNNKIIAESHTETHWSIWIFLVYVIWDILTKLYIKDKKTLVHKWELEAYFKGSYQAILCILLIYFLIRPMNTYHSCIKVVLTDLALLCIFILFRGMKVVKIFDGITYKFLQYLYCVIGPVLVLAACLIANNYLIK